MAGVVPATDAAPGERLVQVATQASGSGQALSLQTPLGPHSLSTTVVLGATRPPSAALDGTGGADEPAPRALAAGPRAIVCVADSRCAVLARLDQIKPLPCASVLTRLRLDAALYEPAPHRQPGTNGRPRLTGKRRPTLEAVWAEEKPPWTTGLVGQ